MRRLAMVTCLMALAGCGSSHEAPLEDSVPVSGVLTYKGQPLPFYRVTLIPVDGRRPATGVTDKEGKFVLSTNLEGDGAPPGPNRVSVAWEGEPAADDGAEPMPIENPALMPKPPVALPKKYADPEQSGVEVVVPEAGLEGHKIDLQ